MVLLTCLKLCRCLNYITESGSARLSLKLDYSCAQIFVGSGPTTPHTKIFWGQYWRLLFLLSVYSILLIPPPILSTQHILGFLNLDIICFKILYNLLLLTLKEFFKNWHTCFCFFFVWRLLWKHIFKTMEWMPAYNKS